MSGIHEFIDNEVKTNDVVLFLKGTPQFPQCGFSGQVVQILDYLVTGEFPGAVMIRPSLTACGWSR
jgi:glutaredoxin-related protein